MKLPGGDRAYVDMAKLRDYCLNPHHLRGRHKARAFAERLDLTATRAEVLREALLWAAREGEAKAGEEDGFGRRFVVEFIMEGPAGPVEIRSAWIVRKDEDIPRLTSCYVV
ncbi:MAG: hypothetical protein C4523_12920 [Myxococcales bacterium]|nr:MAG: hypothetical protein C4523_12920 [Myxococcales bacterium]